LYSSEQSRRSRGVTPGNAFTSKRNAVLECPVHQHTFPHRVGLTGEALSDRLKGTVLRFQKYPMSPAQTAFVG